MLQEHNKNTSTGVFPAAPATATDLTARDLSWFAPHVEDGRSKPYTEVVTITPAIAKRLLETNPKNRNVSMTQVDTIARDISAGRWVMNGETIIVSKDGVLVDGQHRLYAILRADKPVQTFVAFGIDEKSRFTVDMGRQRTLANFLKMEGHKHVFQAASVSNVLLNHSRGVFPARKERSVTTKQEVLHYYRRNQAVIDDAIMRFQGDKICRDFGSAAMATAFIIIGMSPGVTKEEHETFFTKLISGSNLSDGDAILLLRNHLMTVPKGMMLAEKAALIMRYWNKWVTKTPILRRLPFKENWVKVLSKADMEGDDD
jgi:hypothetical protein